MFAPLPTHPSLDNLRIKLWGLLRRALHPPFQLSSHKCNTIVNGPYGYADNWSLNDSLKFFSTTNLPLASTNLMGSIDIIKPLTNV